MVLQHRKRLRGRGRRPVRDRSGMALPTKGDRRRGPETPQVSLVGAGPGDPELLTLKAVRRLQDADVVLFDALTQPAMLEHCRADCQRIYVGKRAGGHGWKQPEITRLLVRLATSGKRVVRLKGGDPFVFGRG